MKKLSLFILMTCLIGPSIAQTDKSEHCPPVEQVEIERLSQPWTHRYYAFNDDNKYFVSGEYVEDRRNGPAPVLSLINSIYEPENKTLSCVYIAFTRPENSRPTLVNVGDY